MSTMEQPILSEYYTLVKLDRSSRARKKRRERRRKYKRIAPKERKRVSRYKRTSKGKRALKRYKRARSKPSYKRKRRGYRRKWVGASANLDTKLNQLLENDTMERVTELIEDVQDLVSSLESAKYENLTEGFANIALLSEMLSGVFYELSEANDGIDAFDVLSHSLIELAEDAGVCATALHTVPGEVSDVAHRSELQEEFTEQLDSLLSALHLFSDLDELEEDDGWDEWYEGDDSDDDDDYDDDDDDDDMDEDFYFDAWDEADDMDYDYDEEMDYDYDERPRKRRKSMKRGKLKYAPKMRRKMRHSRGK